MHGPTGLCQQLSCMAAVLHIANVTHLDMNLKNMLLGKAESGLINHSQVALYDFDMVDLGEARAKCPETFMCGSHQILHSKGNRENGRGKRLNYFIDSIGDAIGASFRIMGVFKVIRDRLGGSIRDFREVKIDSMFFLNIYGPWEHQYPCVRK